VTSAPAGRPTPCTWRLPSTALAGIPARRGLFRARYEAGTLRGLLGLTRPANRYATA
jgi:hypothetical protein